MPYYNNGISNTEVDINGYCIERHDRNSRGGGVAIYIYIKDALKYERKLELEDPHFETLCIEFKISKNLPCLLTQNTTQESISIAFCVSSIRHDSSLSKYRKQKQSPPWTCAVFSISRGGLLLFTVLAE